MIVGRTTILQIQTAVARHFGIRVDQIMSRRRSRCFSHPRQLAMYLARELTTFSYPQIGKYFGRDHATVIYACERVRNDPGMFEHREKLMKQLAAG